MLYSCSWWKALVHWWMRTWPAGATDIQVTLGSFVVIAWYTSSTHVRRILADKRTRRPAMYRYVTQTLQLLTPIVSDVEASNVSDLHHITARAVASHQKYIRPLLDVNERVFWLTMFETMRSTFDEHNNMIHHVNTHQAWRSFLWTVWAKWCFGESVSLRLYASLYEHVQRTMNRVWNMNPFQMGNCNLFQIRKTNMNRNSPINILARSMASQGDGWISTVFKQHQDLGIDCAILSTLAFDFVLSTGQCVISNPQQPERMDAMIPAYFYPIRWRWNGWSLVSLDLVKSRCFFSYGAQSCIGPNIVKIIFDRLFEMIHEKNDAGLIPRTWSWNMAPLEWVGRDRPMLISHQSDSLPDKLIVSTRIHLPFLSVRLEENKENHPMKLYHVTSIFYDPKYIHYIASRMYQMIRNQIPLEERHRLVIVSPEARGWPFASIISHTFHCPLVLVRNKGKEKGTSVASVDYSTIYSKQNCIEVSTHAPITFLSRPIIIDDGIASGGSHDAVRRLLLSQFGANTIASIFAFRHCRSDSNPKTIYESDRQQNVYSVFQLCQ